MLGKGRAIAALVALCVIGCNGKKLNGQPDGDDKKLRPAKELVAAYSAKPLKTRVKKYAEAALKMSAGAKSRQDDPGHVRRLFEELIRVKDWKALESVEDHLGHHRRHQLWHALIAGKYRGCGECSRLLTRLAKKRPEQVALMPYHPEARKLLLARLEDKKARAESRAEAAWHLGYLGDRKALEVMRKYAQDPTRVLMTSAPPGERQTLGKCVQRAIKDLEALLAAKTKGAGEKK